jgi:dCMP deaminase
MCAIAGGHPPRPSWDQYFLNIAKAVSLRSTCLRAKHGAVVIDNQNRILSTGYNEAPKGLKGCGDVGCLIVERPNYGPSCFRTIHAELNTLRYLREPSEAHKIYITGAPCTRCLEEVLKYGIKLIVISSDMNFQDQEHRNDMLQKFGAKCDLLPNLM